MQGRTGRLGTMARRRVGMLVAAAALLVPVSTAFGAQRYASPTGTGPATTCPQSDPCDLDTAVEHSSVLDGDEVIVTPGTYNVTQLDIGDAIDLHGQASQPRPTINVSSPFGVFVVDAATIRDLIVTSSSQTAIWVHNNGAGATIERVQASAAQSGATTCWILNSVTIRDTVCRSTASSSRGMGANAGLLDGSQVTVRLRNVTAVGTVAGLDFSYSNNGVSVTVDAKSVIAFGGGFDVGAQQSNGATVVVNLTNSNYNVESENGGATVTNPGSGTNQLALPQFVNAAAGDYHQAANSPTIDTGVLDAFSGTTDFEGDARLLEGDGVCPTAVDIGADEYVGTAPLDCDPPDTLISGGPTGLTADNTPTFDLASTEPGSTFACRIDGGVFLPCTTPYTTPPLSDGPHTFEVLATDTSGNVDPTPASRTFTVDTTPPDTSIAGGPTGLTTNAAPAFDLSSDDPGATFECRMDGEAFTPCTTPYASATLTDGSHALEVRAIDVVGNVDTTPASRAFTVDTRSPRTTFSATPKAKIKTKRKRVRVRFKFGADEAATFECALDRASYSPCVSPLAFKVKKGKHVLAVRATDEAGNTNGSPATAKFKVKRRR